jgi:8-oxo-dGTP diphosphatase
MTSVIRVSAGVLTRGRQLLICQRRAIDPHALKWEFPGGKVEEGEDEAACLQRELREELAIDATIGTELHRAVHTYTNGRTVALSFFHVPTYSGEMRNLQFHTVAWVEPSQLPAYDFLDGDLAFVAALAGGAWSFIFSEYNP